MSCLDSRAKLAMAVNRVAWRFWKPPSTYAKHPGSRTKPYELVTKINCWSSLKIERPHMLHRELYSNENHLEALRHIKGITISLLLRTLRVSKAMGRYRVVGLPTKTRSRLDSPVTCISSD